MYIYGVKANFFRKLVAFLLLKCLFYVGFYFFKPFSPFNSSISCVLTDIK